MSDVKIPHSNYLNRNGNPRSKTESAISEFKKLLDDKTHIDNQTEELPDEIKDDEVTMDFRKQEIDKHAQKLSNQVIEDLFLLMNHNDKIEV